MTYAATDGLARFLHVTSQIDQGVVVQSKILARLAWCWALVLGAMLASCGANAAVFVTRWDPEFNPAFSDLVDTEVGWSGEAFFSVADNCLTPSGTSFVGGSSCSSATLENGTLRFYDMGSGGGDLLNLSWDKSDPGFDASIYLVRSDGVDVTGIFTLPAIEFDNKTLLGRSVDIDLYFVFDLFSTAGYSGPLLSLSVEQCTSKYGHSWCKEQTFLSSTRPGGEGTPAVTWSRVPEPGSVALVGMALLVGGWMRRWSLIARPRR